MQVYVNELNKNNDKTRKMKYDNISWVPDFTTMFLSLAIEHRTSGFETILEKTQKQNEKN